MREPHDVAPVPVRALALAGLAVVQLATFVLTVALLPVVFLVPVAPLPARRLAGLARRLARDWCGVEVPEPYAPRPGPVQPTEDGLYRFDAYLYKSPWFPNYMTWYLWLLYDWATWRDVRWTLVGAPVSLVLGLAALPGGRPVLRLYGRWTRAALGPGRTRPAVTRRRLTPARSGPRTTPEPAHLRWLRRRLHDIGRCAMIVGLSLLDVVVLAVLTVGFVLGFGLGLIFVLPPFIEGARWLPALRRRMVTDWGGPEVDSPYVPPPEPPVRTADGMYRYGQRLFKTERWAVLTARIEWVLADIATYRDLVWLVLDPVTAGLVAAVPLVLAWVGLLHLALPGLAAAVGDDGVWRAYGQLPPLLSIVVGLAMVLIGLVLAPAAVRFNARWTPVLLGPTRQGRQAQRVAELTRSRAEASQAQAAELRRIERDLHDGAQARLVAVGLHLGAAERLIDDDPVAAKAALAQARDTSARALAELRALVRGIHPPVLAERGLADAVRALALDSAVPVTVTIDLPGRVDDPVAAAVYFAVAELLGNAARHAGPARVAVDLRHRDGRLRVRVSDEGPGGADPARGSGLRGLRRRLAAFDGTVDIVSPSGGPTVVTLELPCVLSSPKTSTSSGTA